MRRDITKVCNLVRAHALLHRANRARNSIGEIVATLHDYAVVRDLVHDLLAESAQAAIPADVRQTVEAVMAISKHGLTGVSERELVARLNLHKSVVSRRVWKAIELGYLDDLGYGRGHRKVLVVGQPLREDGKVLPSVGEVAEFMAGRSGEEVVAAA